MKLPEILQGVDELSDDELDTLQEHVNQRQRQWIIRSRRIFIGVVIASVMLVLAAVIYSTNRVNDTQQAVETASTQVADANATLTPFSLTLDRWKRLRLLLHWRQYNRRTHKVLTRQYRLKVIATRWQARALFGSIKTKMMHWPLRLKPSLLPHHQTPCKRSFIRLPPIHIIAAASNRSG